MKRNELQEGVEYAVFMTPGAARAWLNGRYRYSDKPLKATLVSTTLVTERRWRNKGSWESYGEECPETGYPVIIEGVKDVRKDIAVVQRNKDGSPKFKVQKGYGKRRVTKTTTFAYETILLENAGCFVMTWAEYQAEVKAEKEQEQRWADQDKREREENSAQERETHRRIEFILARLRDMAGQGAQIRKDKGYGGKELYAVDIMVPTTNPDEDDLNTVGQPKMKSLIRGEYLYGKGSGEGKNRYGDKVYLEVVTGMTFKTNDRSLARLLGLEEA